MSNDKQTIAKHIEALRELSWLYHQALMFCKPRRFVRVERTAGDSGLNEVEREMEMAYLEAAQKVRAALKKLLATGFNVPDLWLTVRAVGEVGRHDSRIEPSKKKAVGKAKTVSAEEMLKWPWKIVVTDTGADLAGLKRVLEEMSVAILKLEARESIAATGEMEDLDATAKAGEKKPPESRCAPMKKTEIAARILNKPGKGVRARDAKEIMDKCDPHYEGNGRWSIRLDLPDTLSAEAIARLKEIDWPPPA